MKKTNKKRNLFKHAVTLGGALAVFAAGIYGSYKQVNSDIEKINTTTETMILDNVRDGLFEESNKLEGLEQAAYAIVDGYFNKEKNIDIVLSNTGNIEAGADSVGGFQLTKGGLIKEISVVKDGAYVKLSSQSKEYQNIIELRERLADTLLNSEMFFNGEIIAGVDNKEVINFTKFTLDNFDASPEGWKVEEGVKMTLFSTFVLLGSAATWELLSKGVKKLQQEYDNRKEL